MMQKIEAVVVEQPGEIGYRVASGFEWAVKKFFDNPENNARFEAWQEEQKRKTEQEQTESE